MSLSVENTYPEFFEVFLPEHSSDTLRIPGAFLDHLNHKLPKKVMVRNRLGNYWLVEVLETEDEFLFQKGWSKFVSDNSLQVGEVLVFKYNGNHIFDILVLETSGCEKEQTGASQCHMNILQEEKNLRTQEEEEEEDETRGNEKAGNSPRSRTAGGRGKNYSVCGYQAAQLYEGIEDFLPTNNPFFVTRLRKTRTGELTIPYDIRRDFSLKLSDNIKLQDPEGRLWEGKIISWKDGRVGVKEGWKKLCKWNKVTLDDIIICEFLPSDTPTREVIKVQIIRSKKPKRGSLHLQGGGLRVFTLN